MNKINCIYKEPGKTARAKMIENELEAFQAAVGGYIETVPLVNGFLMLVNEEGKLRGLEHNFYVERTGGRISFTPDASSAHDDIRGPIVILRTDGEEFASLGPMEQDEILETFWLLDCVGGVRPQTAKNGR